LQENASSSEHSQATVAYFFQRVFFAESIGFTKLEWIETKVTRSPVAGDARLSDGITRDD
jgi:hypothetical protein